MRHSDDRADRAAQEWLDEIGAEGALASGEVDAEDDLALYALLYSALREDDGAAPAVAAERVEASIRRIESGRMHPLEIVLAAMAVVIALLLASTSLAGVAEHLGGVLDLPHPFAFVAGVAAVLLLAGFERIIGVRKRNGARSR